jgi:hypothetical protein
MKKIYLMALTAVFTLSVNAQTSKKKSVTPVSEKTSNSNLIAKNGNSNSKTTASIWSDDFSNPANWTLSETAGTTSWTIGTVSGQGTYSLAPIASTSAANGFALFDSDFGCDGDQVADMTTASSISCTGHPSVRLRFQQNYARWYDSTFVFISNDGSTWSKYVVNDLDTNDQRSTNPEHISIDISSAAGNQATVWVRFEFYSPASLDALNAGCGYNWMIDDVYIEDIPAHDVQVNALGVLTSTSNVAGSFNCSLGTQFVAAQILNVGPASESNITVNYSVNGAISTPTVYTGTIPSGDSAQVLLPMPFNFTPTDYYVVKAWTVYATDGDISNDTSSIAITNTTPTPLTSSIYTNGIESDYDFTSLNLDFVSGIGYVFGPSTVTFHAGSQALFYTVPSNTIIPINEAMVVLPCMEVTSGDTYRISYWRRSNTGGMAGVFTGLAQDAASMTTTLKPYASMTPLGLWKKDSVDYVATATETRYFALGGKGDATTASINVRYDDIKIEKVTITTGIKTIAANDAISIFPNPTTGILNITSVEANSSIEIINIIGEKVYTNTLVKGNNVVDLSSLANGSYFLKLNSNNTTTTKKVVLAK